MEDDGVQQGSSVDQVAVSYCCAQFAGGFHVLEKATVKETFTLCVELPSEYSTPITVLGSSCSGSGGYDDIDEGTQVTVKNGKGEVLKTTTLGAGGVFPVNQTSHVCHRPFSARLRATGL